MEKVLITKAQASAIESIKAAMASDSSGTFKSMASVIKYKMLEGVRFHESRAAANALSDDIFIQALTVGYEIQLDPAAQLAELIEELKELRKFTQERVECFEGCANQWDRAKHGAYQRVDIKVKAILAKVGE